MRSRLAVLLVLLAVASAWAEIPPEYRAICTAYDLTSTSYTYPLLAGTPLSGSARIKTTGSSTTVTAASDSPFTDVNVGDELTVQTAQSTIVVRTVVAKASGSSITVDSAADLSGNGSTGYSFSYRSLSDGTGATQGWIKVSQYTEKNFVWEVNAIAATNIAVRIECISSSPVANPVVIYPPTGGTGQCGSGVVTTAGITARCSVVAYEPWDRCRVGYAITGDVGTQSITTGFIGRVAR